MKRLHQHVRAHPRLVGSVAVGLVTALLLPPGLGLTTRSLLAWNVAVWLYLVLIGWMMLRADHGHLRRVAANQAEGARVVLALVSVAAVVSLLGMVVELSAAKQAGAPHALSHVAFALATVVGSWLLLPMSFALTYASAYYHPGGPSGVNPAAPGGLLFPGAGPDFHPDYADFLYLAFTIAVASQTADVAIATPRLRRLVLLQSLMSFAFNTAILAFTVNLAASLF